LPVAYHQSTLHRISFEAELDKLIIHGILHLKGFDHERNESAYKIMRKLESVLYDELKKQDFPSWISLEQKTSLKNKGAVN
jgi:probable rRNA maturation factor